MNNKAKILKIEMMEANIIQKKKMIQQDAMKIKKGSKNNKNPSQSKWLEEEVENPFFCLRFCSIDLF
ncbi:hypothetical protein [Helicobacter pylori]|nr:hypothetical protein [Helicobacter pylori]